MKERICALGAALLFVLCSASRVLADSITLKSGEVLDGHIVRKTEADIEIEVSLGSGGTQIRTFAREVIKAIKEDTPEEKAHSAAYKALDKYQLDANQERTVEQCTNAIAAFSKFLLDYPQSVHA